MANQFGKSRPQDRPYAIYRNHQGWEWRVLKTYKQPSSELKDPYARWFVAATSPHMFDGEYEMGGTSWLYLSPVTFSKVGMREDLGTTSAPELTSGALAAVPAVVSLWPVLLTGVYAISRRKDKIAQSEKAEAVSQALSQASAEKEAKLAELRDKLTREKDAAIAYEVKKALEEVESKARETESVHDPDDEVSGSEPEEEK